jgi:putative SOS response-associated peptidase YedK
MSFLVLFPARSSVSLAFGIETDTADGLVESLTILTCAPGADCKPYHNRQPVILEQEQWAA